jgi:hypothetical protein
MSDCSRSRRTPLGLGARGSLAGAVALLAVTLLADGGLAQSPLAYESPAASGALLRPMATSIRLVAASSTVRRGCLRAARRLKAAVYCPTRVPAGWSPQICAGCNGTFSATGWFPAPKGYVGQPGERTGHFNVWSSPPRLIREGYVGCANGTRSGARLRIAHLRMAWIVCPEGSTLDSGHIVLQWSRGQWIYGLSLHSDTSTNRATLRAIARSLVRVT